MQYCIDSQDSSGYLSFGAPSVPLHFVAAKIPTSRKFIGWGWMPTLVTPTSMSFAPDTARLGLQIDLTPCVAGAVFRWNRPGLLMGRTVLKGCGTPDPKPKSELHYASVTGSKPRYWGAHNYRLQFVNWVHCHTVFLPQGCSWCSKPLTLTFCYMFE